MNIEQLRSLRWMIGTGPKASSCPADLRKVLTVSPESQTFHLRLLVHAFTEAGRRLRVSARARMRLSVEAFDAMADYACMFSSVLSEARALSSWNSDKEAELMKSFFQQRLNCLTYCRTSFLFFLLSLIAFLNMYCFQLRDYKSDVEAIVQARLPSWRLNHFGAWVDLVEPPQVNSGPVASQQDVIELEDAAHAAKYREVRAKISQDQAAMTKFHAGLEEGKRRTHVVSIMHERGQVEIGKQFLGEI